MKRKSKYRKRKRKNIILWILIVVIGVSAVTICAMKYLEKRSHRITPEEVLLKYVGYLQQKEQ